MTQNTLESITRLIVYTLNSEESHYEQMIDEHGHDSEQVQNHAYTLAWNIATELEITL
jgi:hypothetical protein